MSCDRYSIPSWINAPSEDGGGHWDEVSVHFADDDRELCLCALAPDREKPLVAGEVRALALLGAALVLAHHGDLPEGGALPYCLPEKMVREIEVVVGETEWLESRIYTDEQVATMVELAVRLAKLRRRADFAAGEDLHEATDHLTLDDLTRDSVRVDDIEEAIR